MSTNSSTNTEQQVVLKRKITLRSSNATSPSKRRKIHNKPAIFNTYDKPVDKKQDFIIKGEKPSYKYIIVGDGHGFDLVPDCMKKLLWDDIIDMEKDKMYEYITNEIAKIIGDTLQSGSTLSIVKIYKTHIDCYWIGDSSIAIYRNNKMVFKSRDHDSSNPDEIDRVGRLGIMKDPISSIQVLKPNTITKISDYYFNFGSLYFPCKLNMTHSLGHKGKTGHFISHYRFQFKNKGYYKVVIGSDGLWDMICNSDLDKLSDINTDADILGKLALDRWNQSWEHFIPDMHEPDTIFNDIKIPKGDDITVGVWCDYIN